MTASRKPIKDPDLAKAIVALREAAADARKLARQTRAPFIVFKDGQIVDLNAKGGKRSKSTNPPSAH